MENRFGRFRPDLRGGWESAKGRVTPRGAEITTAVTLASIPVVVPFELFLADTIHKISNQTDSGLLETGATVLAAAASIANLTSIAVEREAFEKKKLSGSFWGNVIYAWTGKSGFSSLLHHLVDNGLLVATNPVNAYAISSGDIKLLYSNVAAAFLTGPAWNSLMNSLLLADKMDLFLEKISPFTNRVEGAVGSVREKIKNMRNKKDLPIEPAASPVYSGDLTPGRPVDLRNRRRGWIE